MAAAQGTNVKLELQVFCARCGKVFARPSGPKGRPAKYCSSECRGYQKRPQVDLHCYQCGKAFRRQKGLKAVFCGEKCRNKYWHIGHYRPRPKVRQKCQHCGREFVGRKKRFCSPGCRQKAYQSVRPARLSACEWCGESFQTTGPARFCSLACVGARHTADAKEKQAARYKQCLYCGMAYLPKGANRIKFCSRDCAFALKRERARPKVRRVAFCVVCGNRVSRVSRKTCSEECRRKRAAAKAKEQYQPTPPREYTCLVCGSDFTLQGRGAKGKYCSRRCSNKAGKRQRWLQFRIEQRRRAAIVARGERINPYEIFERDGWRCQLCGKAVKRSAVVPDYKAPVLDHIQPLANGGEHTRRNVQCAHFICNSRRSNVGAAQGRLFADL